MPAKPAWYRDLPRILEELRASPRAYVDRSEVEQVLGIKRRRAQQILAPITERVGSSSIADRKALVDRLQRLAAGDEATYEARRARKVADVVAQMRRERIERPQLLVEMPVSRAHQDFGDLPGGVSIAAGRITIEFIGPQEALEKLLALAVAISNDFAGFESLVGEG